MLLLLNLRYQKQQNVNLVKWGKVTAAAKELKFAQNCKIWSTLVKMTNKIVSFLGSKDAASEKLAFSSSGVAIRLSRGDIWSFWDIDLVSDGKIKVGHRRQSKFTLLTNRSWAYFEIRPLCEPLYRPAVFCECECVMRSRENRFLNYPLFIRQCAPEPSELKDLEEELHTWGNILWPLRLL